MKKLPFDYILINIMIILKSRRIKPIIERDNLIRIIDIIMYNLDINEKEKMHIIEDFDIDYELDNFYNNYIEYFDIENNYILVDDGVTIDVLEEILLDDDTDELILSEIDDLLETNIDIIRLMGVKIRKDIYKWLSLSFRQDEELYSELLKVKEEDGIPEKDIIKEIKLHMFKRKIFLFNLSNLDSDEVYDLTLYSDNIVENLPLEGILFNIENNIFDERNICNMPFQRILFKENASNKYITNYKLSYELEKYLNVNLSKYQDDYKFYLTYYYLLCEEINRLPLGKSKETLNKTKYKLMMLLDGIFDNNLFMNVDNSNLDDYVGNYKHNELEVYFFIEEILSYRDDLYYRENSYVIEYFNIIKKVFIKTYYTLTKDNDIITKIKENKMYNFNKISSDYFSDIIDNSKRRIK